MADARNVRPNGISDPANCPWPWIVDLGGAPEVLPMCQACRFPRYEHCNLFETCDGCHDPVDPCPTAVSMMRFAAETD